MNETKILDMGEAAALMVHGYRMLRMDTARSRRFKIFIFDDPEQNAAYTIRSYNEDELNVPAKRFWDAIRGLKREIGNQAELGQ